MDFSLRDFENLNLYSNKNMEKIISSLVNEASNAVLVNMYDDSLILLDHVEGKFYIADYDFDRDNLTLSIKNFDEINLVKEEEEFQNKVLEFFEEEASVVDLAESYKQDVIEQDTFINELVSEAMSKKDFSNYINYNTIKEAIDETLLESKELKVVNEYTKRIATHPLTEIKLFDWKNDVVVSLVETENVKLINKSAIDRANDLWKKEEFKKAFLEATKVFVEDVEEGTDLYNQLFEEYPQVFFLSDADRKSMLGKALITDKDLRESLSTILKGIDLLFEKYDLADAKKEYLSEADMPDETIKDAEDTDVPSEVEPEDIEKIISDLEAIAKKIEEPSAKEKIDAVIKSLEKVSKEGTNPEAVKEAVSILNL